CETAADAAEVNGQGRHQKEADLTQEKLIFYRDLSLTGRLTLKGNICFIMKPEEEYLSVNWLEYFGNIGRNAQIAQIREHINIKLAKSGLFAILNISDVVNLIKDKSLTVLHEPENGDPSHSGIHGYDHEDLMVAELMAQTVSGVYPARLS
ncbi:MAG: hypothetical protein K9L59_14895, partial [Desulfobacterales bacterium]|nr:hypothetical protein [Desulfobacterales bacterium]